MLDYLSFIFNWRLIRQRLCKGGAAAFACIGVFRTLEWVLTKSISALNVPIDINLKAFYVIAICIAICCGIKESLPKRKVSARIAGTDISISCKICDMLKQRGDITVSVNDTFDTTFEGDFVSPKSLQGRFQLKYYGRKRILLLDNQIEAQLSGDTSYFKLNDRIMSKAKRYSPGKVIKLDVGKWWNIGGRKHAYLLALSQSTAYGTASTLDEHFYSAIQCFWEQIREIGHKETLNIPIIGTGRSGLQKDRMTIIKDIIYSFVTASRNCRGVIVPELIICISPKDAIKYKVDLDDLEKFMYVHCNNNSIFSGEGSSSSRVVNV